MNAHQVAELTARNSYGRLIAYLSVRSNDIAAAEDALSDAFLSALKTWPNSGIPDNPEAWIQVAARRRLIDLSRQKESQSKALNSLIVTKLETAESCAYEKLTFLDERLKLLFICAHPSINPSIHTPLMLQTVLGLTSEQIAFSFLVAPATMAQQLVRAKTKIREAGIAFELPSADVLPVRLAAVLQSIYVAYSHAWENSVDQASRCKGLTQEVIWLARLCVQLMPREPEARGLLALMLYCESRREARQTAEGRYIPLLDQDPALWSHPMIEEAEAELKYAATLKELGRFQLEAAIQSVHSQRIATYQVNWEELAFLYDGLVQLSPTVGALVGAAVAISKVRGAEYGLAQLEKLPAKAISRYQPYWAAKAELLKCLGKQSSSQAAYTRAIGLSEEISVRNFLIQKSSESMSV